MRKSVSLRSVSGTAALGRPNHESPVYKKGKACHPADLPGWLWGGEGSVKDNLLCIP